MHRDSGDGDLEAIHIIPIPGRGIDPYACLRSIHFSPVHSQTQLDHLHILVRYLGHPSHATKYEGGPLKKVDVCQGRPTDCMSTAANAECVELRQFFEFRFKIPSFKLITASLLPAVFSAQVWRAALRHRASYVVTS